jgi:hypothetical protein
VITYAVAMGEGRSGGMRRCTFAAWLGVIAAVVAAQSIVHLAVVFGANRLETVVDLDRSNGLPDLVSTVALGSAAAGAAVAALRTDGASRVVAALLAGSIALLTLADLAHDGAHPSSGVGRLVIAVVAGAAVLTTLVAATSAPRARTTLAIAFCVLAGSFLVIGLDRFDHRFERARGEPIAEYQIVAKEGLELLGWSLVALALWDEALRRRAGALVAPTARTSRARAASRRRVA